MHGIYKTTGAASKAAATGDYRRACALAESLGRQDAVVALPDRPRVGHKTIDRATRKIVIALGEQYYRQFPDCFYSELEADRANQS